MAVEAGTTSHKPGHSLRSWGIGKSHQNVKAQDKSPISTPPLSRSTSTSSIQSTQSEPTRSSSRHEPRKASDVPAQTTTSRKKSIKNWLFGDENEMKEREKKLILDRHMALLNAKRMQDPAYREFQKKHKRPKVKTAGITEYSRSANISAAAQEARYPHSGPPTITVTGVPATATTTTTTTHHLERIESKDAPDYEDTYQRMRREWNEATDHNMDNIAERQSRLTSPAISPWASPIQSRDPSPNRMSGTRTPKSTCAGRYYRDRNGKWIKKDTTPPLVHRHSGGIPHADFSASSLAERLRAL